jgi:hypothetical protein
MMNMWGEIFESFILLKPRMQPLNNIFLTRKRILVISQRFSYGDDKKFIDIDLKIFSFLRAEVYLRIGDARFNSGRHVFQESYMH